MSAARPNEALIDEAAQWMALLHSGRASAQEEQAFAAWRASDPSREEIYRLMSGGLNQLQNPGLHRLPRQAVRHSLEAPSRRRFIEGLLGLTGVAIALGLAGRYSVGTSGGPLAWLPESGQLQTATAERLSATLVDGSSLILNAQTTVVPRFDDLQRLLLLRQGNLWIDVAQDPQRPFVVETEHGRLRALNSRLPDTRFLAERDDEATRIVMLNAQVELRTRSGQLQVISAGQSARFNAQEILEVTASSGHEQSWTDGQLEVRDWPLAEVIRQLRSYRRGIIRVSDQAAQLRLSGIYPLDDSDRTLRLLERSLPIQITYHSAYWVSIDVHPQHA